MLPLVAVMQTPQVPVILLLVVGAVTSLVALAPSLVGVSKIRQLHQMQLSLGEPIIKLQMIMLS